MKSYKKVFVALDGTDVQSGIFRRALRIALNNEAALYLGQVVDMSRYDLASTYDADLVTEVIEFAKSQLGGMVEEAKNAGVVEVEPIVKYGSVRQTLLEDIINPLDPDLVICGDRGLSRVQYALVGSVSTYLVHHVTCDILVVKDKGIDIS